MGAEISRAHRVLVASKHPVYHRDNLGVTGLNPTLTTTKSKSISYYYSLLTGRETEAPKSCVLPEARTHSGEVACMSRGVKVGRCA